MTEPENLEEDLFADLYEDSEPAKSAPAAADQSAAAPTIETATYQDAYDTAGADHYDASGGDANDAYEDDDDDIQIDLGNSGGSAPQQPDTPTTYSTPAPAPPTKGPNAKEDGKMFIGGLNWETTDQSLRDYFSQFGEVTECTVMRDGSTGRSRGFGFLTFKDPKTVNIVMVKEHYLDGKIIDPKRAIPRDEQEKTSKIFVGGVSQETTDAEFKEYFAQFGRVVDATLMMDKDTGRPRGFGFVTFESEAGVEACLNTHLEIHGKAIEVKKAQPRGNMREEEEANRRAGKFGRNKGGPGGGGVDMEDGSGGGGQAAMGGMTPQIMAQYWQRMQQYFAMMQQQMAMNRGMGMGAMQMNPAMMQQMQQMQMMQMMQQQQQAGRGGPGNASPMAGGMPNMNPQMMQQMMGQMGQMGQMGGAPAGAPAGGAASGGSQSGGSQSGGAPRAGYNAYEQQQSFEQQKYEQQRRGGSQGSYGVGGGGGGGAAPTSWEGMYDDVPQPNPNPGGGGGRAGGFHRNRGAHHQQSPSDPNNAPPANAPTGPKNAGRPGANYRGGGRGGRTGFHPYGRG